MHPITYLKIKKENIPKEIKCYEENGKSYLKCGMARPINIRFPIILNEDIAKIAAMIMDGSVIRDHSSVMFSQKKDPQKVEEFAEICHKIFNIPGKVYKQDDGCLRLNYSSKTLAKFFHSCLDIHKSDEFARIPCWIWNSPESVVVTYLRYAFAMEGSVCDYLKGNEVKFHSCDLPYLKELRKLLKIKFDIDSKIQTYYIKDYGYKYYLYFSDKENITKFLKIGFALESHQKRLEKMVENFKPRAWEVTLVKILDIKNKFFRAGEVNELFDYLGEWAIYDRLRKLIKRNYLSRNKKSYYLTPEGLEKALSLKNKIKITKLRTKPEDNEKQILSYLKENKTSYRNEIARKLKISPTTIRDTLKRLLDKDEIKLIKVDRFQRKFYETK